MTNELTKVFLVYEDMGYDGRTLCSAHRTEHNAQKVANELTNELNETEATYTNYYVEEHVLEE